LRDANNQMTSSIESNTGSCDVLFIGEQTAHVARLISALIGQGIKPVVMNRPHLVEQLTEEYGVQVDHIDNPPVHLWGRYRWAWLRKLEPALNRRRLKQVLDRVRPRVIHLNFIKSDFALLTSLGKQCPPIVATAWGSDLNRDAAQGSPLRQGIIQVLHSAAAVTTASPALMQRVRELAPDQDESALQVINFGIDLEPFETPQAAVQAEAWRDRLDIPEDAVVVLAPRRINTRYCPENVLQAFARCKFAQRGVLVYKLIGDNQAAEEKQQTMLTKLAAELNVKGRLRFAPPCTYQEIPGLYRLAQVACFLLANDGAPTTAFELMAAGVPFVAADIPGYQGVLRDGHNAHLVPLNDHQAAADKLDYLVNNSADLQQHTAQVRQWVQNHASMEHTLQQYLKIYNRLMS